MVMRGVKVTMTAETVPAGRAWELAGTVLEAAMRAVALMVA